MSWQVFLNIDWSNLSEDSIFSQTNVSKTKKQKSERLQALQNEVVEAGRTVDTRFDRFSEYAGHQIRQVRLGHQSEDEAFNSVLLWTKDKMSPPWDNLRIHSEFHALLNKDKQNHAETWADKGKPPLTLIGMAPLNSNNSNNSGLKPWEEPEPLIEKIDYVEYPIDQLPEVMSQAALEYQSYAQIPMAMAGGILLASASLAVQGLVNVRRDNALCGPVTLNVITIAESGERKTSADKILGAGVREWESESEENWSKNYRKYLAELSAHEKKVKGLERAVINEAKNIASKTLGGLEHQLKEMQLNAPKKPIKPTLFYMDFTVEALISDLEQGFPVASAWTDEAGIIVGGHSLREGALAAFAIFNVLWDGKDYKVNRKTVSNAYVRGRRLSLNLSMQKDVFNHLCNLEGGKSRSTGWMARALLSMPPTTIGTRLFKEATEMLDIKRFGELLKSLLNSLPDFNAMDNARVTPQEMCFSSEAKRIWIEYANLCEKRQANFEQYEAMRDFASKSAEQAARIAAIFQVIETQNINCDISEVNMKRAIAVAQWYLDEAGRVLSEILIPDALHEATLMLSWLLQRREDHGQQSFTTKEISQYGPNSLRKKDKRNECLSILGQHNYIQATKNDKTVTVHLNPIVKGL